MNPIPLLKNSDLQNQLNTNGFVTIPFLDTEEITKLREFYSEIHKDGVPDKIDGIHMTTWCSDFDYKMKVASFLGKFYEEPCKRIFDNYRTLNNVFIVKEQGNTPFKVHQDWNVVDEINNFAINVWIPLHDVDSSNGALWILEKSHTLERNIRGSAYLFPNYSPFFDKLEEAAVSVPLKAGQAIIFYVNAIHGSPSNLTNKERVASCFSVIPKQAPLHIYFQKSENDPLEVHSPSDDFMYQYTSLRTETFERPPTNNPIKINPSYKNKPVTLSELNPFLVKKKSFFRSLFRK